MVKSYILGCNGGDFQKWSYTNNGELKHKQSGNCLDSNGKELYILGCNGGDFQKWNRDGDLLKHRKSGNCLDSNGDKTYILGCNGGDFQKWNI